jgi:hypothetical protein
MTHMHNIHIFNPVPMEPAGAPEIHYSGNMYTKSFLYIHEGVERYHQQGLQIIMLAVQRIQSFNSPTS